MKRAKGIKAVVVCLAAALLFAALVHGVVVVAGVSQPAATTVYGLTFRRVWASAAAALALGGVAAGAVALLRPASRARRFGAQVALIAGPVAALNGLLNVAVATGGPGTGNGVVGGAAAVVLGVVAAACGGFALGRPALPGSTLVRE